MTRLIRPSTAVAVTAVAVLLSSTVSAVAATQVTSSMIVNGTIKLKDISPAARKALQGQTGPQGPAGPQGPRGLQGVQGAAGTPGTSLFNAGTLPSGVTVRGVWGGRYMSSVAGTQQNSYLLTYSLPLPAPAPLSDGAVQFGASTAGPVGDADPACTGTVASPTAPAGKVCIYVEESTRLNTTLTGFKLLAAGAASGADALGFTVRMVNIDDPGTTASKQMRAEGTWAYTAP